METAVATRETAEVVQQTQDAPVSMMQVIAQAAADPRCDVAKMQALLAMARQVKADEAEVSFKAAMAELQSELPQFGKDGRIEYDGAVKSRYTRLETIDVVVRPLLAKYGFSLEYDSESNETGMIIHCTISHKQGHSKRSSMPLKLAQLPKETGPKNNGATVSYGRRYLLCMMLNIITKGEDTDGTPKYEPITESQALTIETMLKDLGGDPAKNALGLCTVYKATAIREIPSVCYADAVQRIQNRAKNSK